MLSVIVILAFLATLSISSAVDYIQPACPVDETPIYAVKCAVKCADIDEPVCGLQKGSKGKNLITFKNSCTLAGFNCRCPSYKITQLYAGVCKSCGDPIEPCGCTCKKLCPKISDPVCAIPVSGNGQPRNFSNKCELDNYNCDHKPTYKVSYKGECKEKCDEPCIKMCALIVDQICASPVNGDGEPQTFSNQCALDNYNCDHNPKYKFSYKGKCKEKCDEPCEKLCPKIIDPVCAIPVSGNGQPRTFSNKCELDNYNCDHKPKYKVSYKGKCKEECDEPCKKSCALIVDKICASPVSGDGEPQTFSNQCELDNYNCDHNPKYKFSYKGKCKEKCDEPCEKLCPKIIDPVCAIPVSGNGQPRTFSNKCELDNYNCDHKPKYKVSYKGKCEEECDEPCKKSCALIVDQICASPVNGDGEPQTFSNQCELDNYNCDHNPKYKFSYKGKCKEKCDEPCEKLCPKIIDPVCAIPVSGNGQPRTFSNKCELDNYNCDHKPKYKVSYKGKCEEECDEPCKKSCALIVDKICASPVSGDGEPQTFSNQCELDNYNCDHNPKFKFSYKGECEICFDVPCIKLCPKIRDPVCAVPVGGNGLPKTFSNQCALDNYNCDHKPKYKFSYKGDCKEK